jgi:hypothetical protein
MSEARPWGSYEIVLDSEKTKVKTITVLPGKRLSLQTHEKRSEYWVIVQGTGLVRLDNQEAMCLAGDAFVIEEGMAHRITNTGEDDLVFVEVQLGTYFGEDDIVRLEDDFGRA